MRYLYIFGGAMLGVSLSSFLADEYATAATTLLVGLFSHFIAYDLERELWRKHGP